MRWLIPLILVLSPSPIPAAAGFPTCRLALVLAMDVSSSVDEREDRLQRLGLARALTSPEVTDAMLAIPGAPVALTIFEWSGRTQQVQILDWTLIDSPEDLAGAATRVAESRRRHRDFPTALGHALGHAALLLEIAPPCARQVIDISGDGQNNAGIQPRDAYTTFALGDVTVNGLAIDGASEGIVEYYRHNLIRGPGSFVIAAEGFHDFERAMRRKLVREISPLHLSAR